MEERAEDSENDQPDLTTGFDDAYSEQPDSDDSVKQ